jgi:PKD repeat protein
MKKSTLLALTFIFLLMSNSMNSQDTIRALFIGNSYTYFNNLPDIIKNLAVSNGDTLIHLSSTPGGYTFQQHSTNATTLSYIQQGNWDYVVLQQQSQMPSFPDSDVAANTYPYARILDSMINAYNDCAETVFYMTWGRQNGDASNCANWPPVCTYEGMDSLLRLRYTIMANDNDAILSPVAAVWRYIRQNWPSINLYNADGSHPSPEGSYAAACAFYSVMYRKNPVLCPYNFGLADADSIKAVTERIVFNNLDFWNVGKFDPNANFSFQLNGTANEVSFSDSSLYADSYHWNFGDGSTDSVANPVHVFDSSGVYDVTLTINSCGKSDSVTKQVQISIPSLIASDWNNLIKIYPNPVKDFLTVSNPENIYTEIIIQNALGQFTLSQSFSQSNKLDISHLKSGIYFLQIYNSEGKIILNQKLIKL